jgi:hypothetical protein
VWAGGRDRQHNEYGNGTVERTSGRLTKPAP